MRYPAANDGKVPEAVLQMFSDYRFVTPTVLTARAASKTTAVYMYRFSRVSPLSRSRGGGAAHTAEVEYVWDHIAADTSQYEAVDRALSHAIAGAWVQFAKTGNPNGASLPQWPPYKAPEYRLLEYGNEITIKSNDGDPNITFFQRVFETMRTKPTSPRKH